MPMMMVWQSFCGGFFLCPRSKCFIFHLFAWFFIYPSHICLRGVQSALFLLSLFQVLLLLFRLLMPSLHELNGGSSSAPVITVFFFFVFIFFVVTSYSRAPGEDLSIKKVNAPGLVPQNLFDFWVVWKTNHNICSLFLMKNKKIMLSFFQAVWSAV